MPKALVIIAQEGFQDQEYQGTVDGLTAAGIEVTVASKEAGECTGKFGGTQESSIALRDVDVSEYDKIAFIGGPGASVFVGDNDALQIARSASEADMPLGAICIAPTILAKAGVLGGKRATVWESPENVETFEKYGAQYTGEVVSIDGNIVTGNGPDAAIEFGKTLASL